MHCISCALKRKVEKPLLFKQTLKSRFTCLACQHFSFDAKKSLDRERPFSLALRVVSLFSCLSHLALSVTRVAIYVSRVLLDGLQKKKRLLVVYFFPLLRTFYFETRPSPLSKIKENAFGAHFLQHYCKNEYGDPHFLFHDFNKDSASFR